MLSIQDYLRDIGLSSSEVALYLAGLKMGEVGVQELVAKTGVKRPTAYHALNELVSKGLADEKKQGKLLSYVMRPPADITGFLHDKMSSLSEQERLLDQLLPLFPKQSFLAPQSDLNVYQYSGEESVRRLIDVALHCRSKTWDILAPRNNFIAHSDQAYIDYFKRVRMQQGIESRSLWEEKLPQRELKLRDIASRKPRYLPKAYKGKFQSMMILFDKSVALISPYEQQEGLLIQSAQYHNLLSILFEAMWVQAEKA
jgi:predicted transcriptional regulator